MKPRGIAAGLLFAGAAMSLPGMAVSAAPPPSSVVLVDASGHCGATPVSSKHWNPTCRAPKGANAVTNSFIMPRGPWGIAFAFRCHGAGDFSVVVGLPGLDGNLPSTAIYRHGYQEAGFEMETGKGRDELNSVPTQWRTPQNLHVLSRCAWHVRAVRGGRAVVRRMVPAIPA